MCELDERVAEEILGWVAKEGDEIPEYISSRGIPPDRGHFKKVWMYRPNEKANWERMACLECGDFPLYSEDILTAWLLVEHIQKLYPWCRFSICGGDLEMGNWTARFYGDAPNARDDKPFSWSRSYQDTAPLAIVHAALGAVPSIRAYLATL